jgi:hypothetical protein
MPLVLYGTTDQTYPLPDTISAQKLNYGLQHISNSILNTEHSNGRLANIIITWNVLQHFYPYFDDIKVDWKQELSKSLNNVIQVNTEIDYFKCLSLMISKLEDGHGVVSCININRWGFPVSFVYVENKVVVSGSNSSLFKTGDIIESVDGKSAYDELGLQESYISGSPQLKRYRALNVFGSSFLETPAKIILLRDGKKLSIKADRDTECNLFFNDFNSRNFNSNNKALDCGDSIYYEKSGTYFYTELDKLIEAKGIIVSSYFNVMEIIPHLIKEPLWSPRWRVPITTYPDREKVVFDTSRWKIEPMKPFIKAKVVFIVEPFNVSYGETLLSFIDYYKLGKLVGDTTAGTNGNVNFIPLLGRYSIMWTGMKVLKHDGSQLHLTGYRPDYPVKRTIHGIREGRDEYLDKALEILKK